jgi:hypothetical protein
MTDHDKLIALSRKLLDAADAALASDNLALHAQLVLVRGRVLDVIRALSVTTTTTLQKAA